MHTFFCSILSFLLPFLCYVVYMSSKYLMNKDVLVINTQVTAIGS